MNKKIDLLVLPGFFPEYEGDIKGIFVLDYLESVKKYCNISVFVFQFLGKKRGLNIERRNGVTIYRYVFLDKQKISKVKRYLFYLKWIRTGEKIILKNIKNIQIIHAHGSVRYGNLARKVSKKLNIQYVVTEHTSPFSKISDNFFFRFLSKKAFENAGVVLPVSYDLKKQIRDSDINPKKIEIIYNPVNTKIFSLKKRRNGKKSFLFAGRLENYKGPLRCVKAFNNILDQYPDWCFKIVGDGPQKKEIETFLKKNPVLGKKVEMTGKLSKFEIAKIMRNCDFFIHPSEHETFGISIAEAMASGLPVIVGNKTAPLEFVDNESGILVDPNSIDEIAGAIEFMIKNHHKYNRELIRKKIVDRFSFKVFGDRLIKIYRELL